MGRPPKATYEQVVIAAERLTKEGKKLTLRSVHEIVGGSMSTVAPFYNRYIDTHRPVTLRQPEIKPPTDNLTTVFNQEVQRQMTELHLEYEGLLQESKETILYLQDQFDRMEQKLEELQVSEAELREKNSQLVGRDNLQKEEKEQLRKQATEAIERAAKLEGRIMELERKNVEIKTVPKSRVTTPKQKTSSSRSKATLSPKTTEDK